MHFSSTGTEVMRIRSTYLATAAGDISPLRIFNASPAVSLSSTRGSCIYSATQGAVWAFSQPLHDVWLCEESCSRVPQSARYTEGKQQQAISTARLWRHSASYQKALNHRSELLANIDYIPEVNPQPILRKGAGRLACKTSTASVYWPPTM